MINIPAYIKPRIVILATALLFVFVIKFIFRSTNIKKESKQNFISLKVSDTSPSKKLSKRLNKTKNIKKNNVLPKKSKCTFPQISPLNSSILKTVFISIYPLTPVKENRELNKFIAGTKSRISLNNIENFHISGKILFYRAIYLKSLENSSNKIENKWGIIVPSSKKELKNKYLTLFRKAQALLVKVRPFPNYKMWSDALYLNSWALYLIGNKKEAIRFLNIIARTRSTAKPANYARFALGIIFSKMGFYKKSSIQFKKIKIMNNQFEKIKNFYVKINKIMLRENLKKSVRETVFENKNNHDFLKGLVEFLSLNCKNKSDPSGYIKSLLKHIPSEYKTGFIAGCRNVLNSESQTKNRDLLCNMIKGL